MYGYNRELLMDLAKISIPMSKVFIHLSGVVLESLPLEKYTP